MKSNSLGDRSVVPVRKVVTTMDDFECPCAAEKNTYKPPLREKIACGTSIFVALLFSFGCTVYVVFF